MAGSAITNVPTSTINGDVGLSPAAGSNYGAGLTPLQVSGTIYAVDVTGPAGVAGNNPGLVNQAKTDLITAYDNAAGRTPTATFTGNNSLGGKTLTSGVYSLASGTTDLDGTLTLDAQGDENAVFIFQASSTLTTASNSVVSLINGARFCWVFWVVPSSATLGTGSTFVGHMFALTSISVTTSVTVYGQLLAQNGAVTLDQDTITNGPCPTIAAASSTVFTITESIEGNGSITRGNGSVTPSGVFSISSGQSMDYIIKPNEGETIVDVLVNGVSVGPVPYYLFLNVTSNQTIRAIFSNAAATAIETTIKEAAVEETTTTAPPVAGTTTVTGGQLPKTGTPWYNILLIGIVLILTGAISWVVVKKKRTE